MNEPVKTVTPTLVVISIIRIGKKKNGHMLRSFFLDKPSSSKRTGLLCGVGIGRGEGQRQQQQLAAKKLKALRYNCKCSTHIMDLPKYAL